MIAIVDYGMGNLRSVQKGFERVGLDARITSSPSLVDDAEGVVLPGVGAFRDCMKNLGDLNLTDSVVRAINKGKPFFGICLGLQVLFSESLEFGSCRGLDIFRGRVIRFPEKDDFKVPHMGWNTIKIVKDAPVLTEVPDGSYLYFVHSFYVVPEDESIVATKTQYSVEFTSMIWKDNIIACQFHPEKSQSIGLRMLKAFGDFVKRS